MSQGAQGKIDENNLIGYATRFSLGRHDVDTLPGRPPVHIEKARGGWVVRAEHPGSMTPHYLNEEQPRWRYKQGTSFDTAAAAVRSFNSWLAAARTAVDKSEEGDASA